MVRKTAQTVTEADQTFVHLKNLQNIAYLQCFEAIIRQIVQETTSCLCCEIKYPMFTVYVVFSYLRMLSFAWVG